MFENWIVLEMPIRKTLGDYRLTLRMLENTTLNCEIDWQEQISDEQTEYVETPALQYWWLRNGRYSEKKQYYGPTIGSFLQQAWRKRRILWVRVQGKRILDVGECLLLLCKTCDGQHGGVGSLLSPAAIDAWKVGWWKSKIDGAGRVMSINAKAAGKEKCWAVISCSMPAPR